MMAAAVRIININMKKIFTDFKKCTINKKTAVKIVYKTKLAQFITIDGYITIFMTIIIKINAKYPHKK